MRLLVVSRLFPPPDTARGQQMAKVVDALTDAGVEVTVVAGGASAPGPARRVRVVRVPERSLDGSLPPVGAALLRPLATRWTRRAWLADATRAVVREVDARRPDLVLTASTPLDSHRVGLRVRRALGLPWLAFFSDPLPPSILPPPYRTLAPAPDRIVDLAITQRVLAGCDGVLATNGFALEVLARGNGVPIGARGFVVPHVAAEPPSPAGAAPDSWLAHVGDTTHRASRPLFEGVLDAARTVPGFSGLRQIGRATDDFRAVARACGADDVVRFEPPVAPDEAARRTASSGAVLVLEADMAESPFLPSKFADASRLGRPILAVTPRVSPVREYLSRHGGGLAVGHDRAAIADALGRLFAPVDRGQPFLPGSLAQAFLPEVVAQAYRQAFERVLARRAAGGRP